MEPLSTASAESAEPSPDARPRLRLVEETGASVPLYDVAPPGRARDRRAAPESSLHGPHLKPYDVRYERNRGSHRHLRQATRRLLRVGSLLLLDSAVGAIALAAAVRASGGGASAFATLLVPVLTVLLLSLLVVNAYGAGSRRRDSLARALGVVLASLLLAFQIPLPHALPLTMPLIGYFAAVGFLLLEAERRIVQLVVSRMRHSGHLLRPVLVIGTAEERQLAEQEFARLPDSDLLIIGRLSTAADAGVLETLSDLERYIDEYDVINVLIGESVPPVAVPDVVSRVFEAGATVMEWPSDVRGAVARLGATPVFDPATMELYAPRLRLPQLELKRSIDLLLSGIALIVCAPFLLGIAIAIRMDSPGPVFFSQTRLGVGGRPFRIWKFRTMVPDAESRRGEVEHLNQYGDRRLFKIPGDPRITRFGAFLRRTSLDELPQLFNVLKGDMSLVGPRPPLPEEVRDYAEHHLVRLTVVPGLTGPWQANGRNDVRDFDEVVRMEREYIRDWSVGLDLRILARTVFAVLRGQGAH